MRILIEQGGVTRELCGSFAILMARDDMEHLVSELQAILSKTDDEGHGTYGDGWASIRERYDFGGGANRRPRPWADGDDDG